MWTAKHRERYEDDGRRYPNDLTDPEWSTISPFLAVCRTMTADLREMVNACLYLQKTGCGWRYLPTGFGPWETVRTWHDRFRADGIWPDIGALLTRAVRQDRGHAAEPSTAILDSQSVVSGPQKGERGVDGSPGLRSRFTRIIDFANYAAPELAAIYRSLVAASGFHLVPDAEDALMEACGTMLRARAETFGNGRAVRTLWERTREAQAGRVMRHADRTADDLVTVKAADIDAAASVGTAA